MKIAKAIDSLKVQQTIDITPSWGAVLRIYVEVAVNGTNSEGRAAAMTELKRMAEAADKWNAHCAAQKIN